MTDRNHNWDALVLGAGGTRGHAWLQGLLAGWEAHADLRFSETEYFVGTSAGSIMAATLAAGLPADVYERAGRAWAEATPRSAPDAAEAFGERMGEALGTRLRSPVRALARGAGRAAAIAASPLAPLALGATAPGGAALRAAVLARGPRPRRRLHGLARELDRLPRHFDGRLRVATVDMATGRRVVFGEPGAPEATVRDAVLASCAVPWLFAPVRIAGRDYVDGGVWTPTNLDAAPVERGARVLCLVPTARGPLRAVTHAALLTEMLVMRARGVRVRIVTPDEGSSQAMGFNLMDPRRLDEVMTAGYAQGQDLAKAASA